MRTVKNKTTHLVFPRDLLEAIDDLFGKRKRSAFVIEATRERLAKEKFLKAVKNAAGAWQDKNHPELKTKKDLNKYIRDLRRPWQKRDQRIYG